MAKTIYLTFEVHLRDADRVAALQADPPGETSAYGDGQHGIIRAPLGAAVEYAADNGGVDLPLLGKTDPIPAGAYITSASFFVSEPEGDERQGQYPVNVATFFRSAGGFLGLFGKKVRFYWLGVFVYDPPLATEDPTGEPGARDLMARRFWIDNFQVGNAVAGNQELWEMSRGASPWVDGVGWAIRAQPEIRQHTRTADRLTGGPALAISGLWERFYLRLISAGGGVQFWRCFGVTQPNIGLILSITPTGQIAVSHSDDLGAVSLIGTLATPLALNTWHKLDLCYRYGGGIGQPPAVRIFLDGVNEITLGGFAAAQQWDSSRLGPYAGGGTTALDIGFWMGAEDLTWGNFNGIDFLNGSRPVAIRPSGFATDHDPAWVGDWRGLAALPPRILDGDAVTTTTPLAELRLAMDAELSIEALPGALGVAAVLVSHHSYRGDNEGQFGYQIGAGPRVLGTGGVDGILGQGLGATNRKTQNLLYAPAPALLPVPITPFELHAVKGSDATVAGTAHLGALAEVIGTFLQCDYPADVPVDLRPPIPWTGIHNAPYPRSLWAQTATPPLAPVVISTGTYVGNGLGQDLTFRAPVHWLWIRRTTGAAQLSRRWWTSMLGAHINGRVTPDCFGVPSCEVDAAFEPAAAAVPTGVGAMPDRGDEVDAIVAQHGDLFVDDDTRRALCGIIARELNATIPADGNNWGLLIKNERNPPFVPADTLVWLPTLEHVDVLSGSGGIWIARDVIQPTWAWLSAGADGQQMGRAVVRIAGTDIDTNAIGEIYCYAAVADPGMRFLMNDALLLADASLPATHALVDPAFTPDAAFLVDTRPAVGNTGIENAPGMSLKGPGHVGQDVTLLDATGTLRASALGLGAGTLVLNTGASAGDSTHLAVAAFRRNDGSDDPGVARVVCLMSYVGTGVASRSIALQPPSQRRPVWILISPHGAAAYMKDCAHVGALSTNVPTGDMSNTTAIVGAGLDEVTVGITLNATGVVYELFALLGGTVDGGAGLSACGEFIPVSPETAAPGAWGDPPEDPVPGEDDPDDPGGPGGDGGGTGDTPGAPGGGPDDIDTDLSTECVPFTKRIFNDALSRIGISKRIRYLLGPTAAPWAAATSYAVRDAATRLGVTYYCVLAHANHAPPNGTYWATVLTPPNDNSEEADLCTQHYARALEATLRDFPWPFATRYAVLTLLGGSTAAPVNRDWTFSYRQPIDCVFERRLAVVREGAVDATPPPFQLSADGVGGRLFTNQAAAQLEYTARPLCTASVGDPLFVDALTWRLASLIAGPLTRIADVTKLCLEEYAKKIAHAGAVVRPGNPGPRTPVDALLLDPGAGALAANTALVNRALLRIGAQTVANLATEQSREAEAARLIFEEELRATLRGYPWAFGTRYLNAPVLVAGTAAVPVNADWIYSYRLPARCVMVRRLVTDWGRSRSERDPEMFRIGSDAAGALLFTRRPPVSVEYTERIPDCVLHGDALFRDAFAWRLAASLAPSLLTADPDATEQLGRGPEERPRERKPTEAQHRARVTQFAWQQYYAVLETARVQDAREQQGDSRDTEADWIRGRE